MNEKAINNYAEGMMCSGLTFYIQYADYGSHAAYYGYYKRESIPAADKYTVAIFKVKCKGQNPLNINKTK